MKLLLLILCLTTLACNLAADQKKWKAELMKTDREFSDMSRQKGMKSAFIDYIDNDGILLRTNHMPIVGADAIDFLSLVNDSSYTLTWSPKAAHVAESGDLGFTYGTYDLKLSDTLLKGNYVSIWKKQKDGKWKFVLDSGNEGLGDEPKNNSTN